MIFATDLDNTMIFSSKRLHNNSLINSNIRCVEYKENTPITYMTQSAIEKVKFIREKCYLIPSTTRSLKQFRRVKLFSNTQYAIVANGGIILHNNRIDTDWKKHIHNIVNNHNLNKLADLMWEIPGIISKPKIINNCFVFAKTKEPELSKQFILETIDTQKLQISIQGQKIYIIPAEISKGNALKYICKKIKSNYPVIAAGDSNLDLSMLLFADYSVIPRDSNLANLEESTRFTQLGTNFDSADRILDYVIMNLDY